MCTTVLFDSMEMVGAFILANKSLIKALSSFSKEIICKEITKINEKNKHDKKC